MLVEYTTFLTIFPRPLNDFWNFPRCANLRCMGYSTMSIEGEVDRPTAVHEPQFLLSCKNPLQYCAGRKLKEGLQEALKESFPLFPLVDLKAEQRLIISKISARRNVFGQRVSLLPGVLNSFNANKSLWISCYRRWLLFRPLYRGISGFFQGGGINVVSIEHIPPKMFQFENLDLVKNYKYKQWSAFPWFLLQHSQCLLM